MPGHILCPGDHFCKQNLPTGIARFESWSEWTPLQTLDCSGHICFLKALAALQGKTIKQYAVERLFPAIGGQDEAWQELKALLGQRIADGLAGEVSTKSIAAVVDEEIDEDSRP